MSESQMKQVFEWLKSLNSVHRVSYSVIGDAIGYSDVGVSKAIKKGTLSLSQVREIAQKTGYGEDFDKQFQTNSNQKTPTKDAGVEYLVAKRVYEELEPLISKMTEEVIKNIGALDMKMKLLSEYTEELHRLQEKTQQSIEVLEKKQ